MKYTSKQVSISRPASTIFHALSNFSNFTPILADRVEGWSATPDRCTFKIKGFTLSLRMEESIPNSTIKVVGDDNGAPFPFSFWIQLKELSEQETRLRLVLDVELNAMMKMLIGGKMQNAVDSIADQIAQGFNNPAHPHYNHTHPTVPTAE